MSSKIGNSLSAGRASGAPVRFHRSLAFRMAVWYAASAFLLLLVACGALYWMLVGSLKREDDGNLSQELAALIDLLRDRPYLSDAVKQEVIWDPAAKSFAPILIRLIDNRGQIVLETPGMSDVLPIGAFPPPSQKRHHVAVWSREGQAFRAMSASLQRGPPLSDVVQIQLALDHSAEEKLLAHYRSRLWIVLCSGVVVCAAGGFFIARAGIRPVVHIAEMMRRVSPATLHQRIDVTGFPAELESLAVTLNGMLHRLEEAFARLSQFSADIAHELRTPINVLRGEAEVALGKERTPEAYRDVLASSLEECARLSRLIDSLLFLARAENPQTQIRRETVDVAAELTNLSEYYDIIATETGVRLDVGADRGLAANLDRTLFQQAVGNLVENALAHTNRGGHVSVNAARDNGNVRVEVLDDGRGIPPDQLPYVFDRFRRVDASRNSQVGGTGLGLAIVKSIAALHGGTVQIASQPGVGTRVSLFFPEASSPTPTPPAAPKN